ncbi:MAG: glutaredoxin family protein [Deltaproteobacteria bacterium]|nr:glutaredoxin family protein [Deltaproteobacteria bacterium]
MRSSFSLIVFAVLASAAVACGHDDDAPAPAPAVVAPAPLTLAADRTDLAFRYVDPASGAVATATTVDAIPAAARSEVVVFDPTAQTPPGYEQVADLTGGLPATTRPIAGFSLKPRLPVPAATATAAAGAGGAHEVVLFSAPGCGYCRQARAFFDSRHVPYSEFDLETDAGARDRLATLARKAGVQPERLQGVPIIFIDGKPMVGFDRGRVAALLGG